MKQIKEPVLSGKPENELYIEMKTPYDKVIALSGNPNVGKSTLFNGLTGLRQHTGNWPGKTVTNAQGKYKHKDTDFIMVDIPGTYSLMANSVEEEVARNFVCFGQPDAVIIVTDATCLERNLNLVLQTLEITDKVVVCVNLIDEAKRKKIRIDFQKLSECLGVPVVPAVARKNIGLAELMDAVYDIAHGRIKTTPYKVLYDERIEQAIDTVRPKVAELVKDKIDSRWVSLQLLDPDSSLLTSLEGFLGFNLMEDKGLQELLAKAKEHMEKNGLPLCRLQDTVVSALVLRGEEIAKKAVTFQDKQYNRLDRKIDGILTSKIFGIPIMLGLLTLVFWITIAGANIPSQFLGSLLFGIGERLSEFFLKLHFPLWLHDLLVLGIYRTVAWVVSVMLPPMAIFFPLFTFLEDLGYLPRVAFNLDNYFKKACAHGKQALTMCMGFGCNAAGVIGCRIIDSPRERLIAILTNNFVPCNGRFPTLIAIGTVFIGGAIGGAFQSAAAVFALTGTVLLGIFMTLTVSRILSKTVLKGLPSSFTLELPPYRKPPIGRIIVRSVFDRTLVVLGRAVTIAAPAGLVLWIMANLTVADKSLLAHTAAFLDPFGRLIGMDGIILLAFFLGLPANEIVIPIIIMGYLSQGSLMELSSLEELQSLFVANGWTWLTGVCVMLFTLFHFPCGTTLWTIKKETQSLKWTVFSFFIPTVIGLSICFLVTQTVRLMGLP
jgi:ferrous iron transport protein B